MKIVAIWLVMISLFAGCSIKTEYEYVKPKAYNFLITPQPKKREIRVYKDDVAIYDAYIKNLRDIISFHNKQIVDYKKSIGVDNASIR